MSAKQSVSVGAAGTNRQPRVAASTSSSSSPSSGHSTATNLSSSAATPTTTTTTTPNSKLVFGLNARAKTRTKYDEYAEQRLRTSTGKASLEAENSSMTKTSTSVADSGTTGSGPISSSLSTSASSKLTKDKTSSTSVRARSRSPERNLSSSSSSLARAMGRRKSFDEDLSTIKTEAPIEIKTTTTSSSESEQPKSRTKFNITPPKQMSIAGTSGKGSVVGFAKARIYDKPAKKILPATSPPQPNPLDPTWTDPWSSSSSSLSSLLDDRQNAIPKSILSGSKPPKQVNVSKAREKWEGGEPFTKCKSRQRLAAQANKKLFPGTWSMTSVVATQQLHLQQARAQAEAKTFKRSNFQETDPSVKVLTRGSVLERVQQYERVPSGANSSSTSITSSQESLVDDDDVEAQEQELEMALELGRSLSLSSLGYTPKQQQQENETTVPLGKKAHYKNRVSSIQQQQQQSPLTTTTTTGPVDALVRSSTLTSSTTPAAAAATQQRRLTLTNRRRSSTTSLISNSTTTSTSIDYSLIPKFYHPNGQKPNTYELELQKRNIVACFDHLPDRSAQLAADNPISRRHFHQIALACSMSEYFKVPLSLYVKHKLDTCPQLFTSNGKAPAARQQRKTSTISLLPQSNGVTTSQPLKKHTRSNSVALNQPLRMLVKASSIDSAVPVVSAQSNGCIVGGNELMSHKLVTCDRFLTCWRELISQAYDNVSRFVHLLTFGSRNYLLPEDFVPLIQSIIDDHPGLKFLRAAPDFHMRYIQTVIARIYFNINKSWTGKITLQELRHSNLLAVLQVLSHEDDINQITDYFSYEHFYVIYCKFWNLDQDHDLLISKTDLARHNDAAISSRIIERIFSNVVSKHTHQTGKMNYSDFVWFLMAEEDKKHPRSIEYWFRLMDLDGDGYISMYEMEYFYHEQMKRLELMNIEPLPFLDSACQILDLVNPREKSKISLADLKHTKMATIFFDTFINLEKYLEHESREFVSTRDVVQDGVVVSDWDRYASEEYENLVTEETTV